MFVKYGYSSICNYVHGAEVLLRKVIFVQRHRNSLRFFGTRKFTAVFTRAHHWPPTWATLIHFTTSHHASWKFFSVLSSYLRLGFLVILEYFTAKGFYAYSLCPIFAVPVKSQLFFYFLTLFIPMCYLIYKV